MKRTFVAIPIPLSSDFIEFIDELKSRMQGEINWVKPENMHLTLAFFGSTSPEMVQIVKDIVLNITAYKQSFNLSPQGLYVFPAKRKPRVMWVGLKHSDDLIDLKSSLMEGLFKAGIDKQEKKFTPHLSLGRIKWIERPENLNGILDKYKNLTFQDMLINRMVYYESELTGTGPVYHILGSYLMQN